MAWRIMKYLNQHHKEAIYSLSFAFVLNAVVEILHAVDALWDDIETGLAVETVSPCLAIAFRNILSLFDSGLSISSQKIRFVTRRLRTG